MPDDKRIPDAAEGEANLDWLVLDLLIDRHQQRPWSVDEVIRAHGHEQNALDALLRLHGDGLIHRTDDFVFATRAAIRYSQISG